MLTQEKELSCKAVIGGLVGTGVSVSLLGEKERLKNKGWMRKLDTEITQADNTPMKIRGMVKLLVKIGGTKSIQRF